MQGIELSLPREGNVNTLY